MFGILAAAGLAGYAITYVVAMPAVGPNAFVPSSMESGPAPSLLFAALQLTFVLIYAFAFLPLVVLFTLRRHSDAPVAVALAGCLMVLSLVLQLLNTLPSVSMMLHPIHAKAVPPDVLLYLRQVDAVRFLAYDVTGFTLAYAAGFVYAVAYLRTRRGLALAVAASIVTFIANVPFLWWMPNMAIILMSVSILIFAALPVTLARMVVEPSGADASQ